VYLSGLRYDKHMKPPPDNAEFAAFTEAMKKIVKVSKVELQRRDKEWGHQPRPRVSRASVSSSKRAD
jgi:hypothetical protein